MLKRGQATKLSNEQLGQIIDSIASGDKLSSICKSFHLGDRRLKDIINKYVNEIADRKIDLERERDENFRLKIGQHRLTIAESISDKDIDEASLTGKTRSLVDLTSIKRLEQGQSTENIAIKSSDLTYEQLKEYAKTGKLPDTE